MTPEEIIDRWRSPAYAWKDEYIIQGVWFSGLGDNPICGDTCRIHVSIADGLVVECYHETTACTLTTAAADLLCENMIGKPIDFEINLFEILGIPIGVNRRQCVLAPIDGFKKALTA